VKCLVLGGSRFIGRRLVEMLLQAGHRVTLMNRGRRMDPFGARVSRIKGDRSHPEDLARAAHAGRDAIFDFLCYDAAGARMAIEAFEGRTARYVMISTGSVYWCTGDFPCPVPEEDFDRLGDFEERPGSIEYAYGYGKRKAEEALFAAHRRGSLPVTACRLPIVGGVMDPTLRYISYFYRIDDGSPLILPGGGLSEFRHVWVDDVAAMLEKIPTIPAAAGRAYNLAAGEIVTLASVVRLSARLLQRELRTVDVRFSELRSRGLDPSFSPFSQAVSQVPAIDRARAELGWEPSPYADWVEAQAKWYRDFYRAGPPPQYAHREKELEVLAAWERDGRPGAERRA
jgi:nucleoside-diphosphate-sugar epimerase